MHNAKYKALSLTMAIITAATPMFSTYPVYAESVNDVMEDESITKVSTDIGEAQTESVLDGTSDTVNIPEENSTGTTETSNTQEGRFLFINLIDAGGKVVINEGENNEEQVRLVKHNDDGKEEVKIDVYDKDSILISTENAEANNYTYAYETTDASVNVVKAIADDGYEVENYNVSKQVSNIDIPEKTDFIQSASFSYNVFTDTNKTIKIGFEQKESEDVNADLSVNNEVETVGEEAGTESINDAESQDLTVNTENEDVNDNDTSDTAESENAGNESEGTSDGYDFTGLTDGIANLNKENFESARLIVLADSADEIVDQEHLIGNYDNIYLLQYESANKAMEAYVYYLANAQAVEPDAIINAADDTNVDENTETEAFTADSNPIAALAENDGTESTKTKEKIIALIDTGVNAGPNVIDRISLIDNILEGNGHGDQMVDAITSQDEDAKILSIRALSNGGKGNISSIISGIEYAINQNVNIINLSMYAKTTMLNSVLGTEIQKAIDNGITVVGAAGNDGADVKDYMPGSIEDAYIIGACDEDGNKLASSNYGTTVDYNFVAESTSEAAAKFTGYINENGIDEIDGDGLIWKGSGSILDNTQKDLTGRTFIISMLKVKIGDDFDPSVTMTDIRKYIGDDNETADIKLSYSDVDMNKVGLYSTIYDIKDNNGEYKVKRPVLVVEGDIQSNDEDKHSVNFIYTNDSGIKVNSAALSYAAGENVSFTVSYLDENKATGVDAYCETSSTENSSVLGDPYEITYDDSIVTAEDEAAGMGENVLKYHFTMPDKAVYIYITTVEDEINTSASGANDELGNFTLVTEAEPAGDKWYRNKTVYASNTPKGSTMRKIKYTAKDANGKKYNEEHICYCIQPAYSTPFKPGTSEKLSDNNSNVKELADGNKVAKALFYLYDGPAWGKTVTATDGTKINMQKVLSKYKQEYTQAGADQGYFCITHFYLGYVYGRGYENDKHGKPKSESIWNYNGLKQQIWNARGIAWMREIMNNLDKLPSPTVLFRDMQSNKDITDKSIPKTDFSYDSSKGEYVSKYILYRALTENKASVNLPDGISLRYKYLDDNDNWVNKTITGKGSVPGGSQIALAVDRTKYTQSSYVMTFTTTLGVNYQAWKISFGGQFQDLAFAYRTKNTKMTLTYNLPNDAYIQVKKTTSNGGWNDNLKNTVFGLYEGSTRLAGVTISGSGYHKFNYACQVGHTYTIKEETVQAGYAKADNITCAITAANFKTTYSYDVANYERPKVQITKKSTAPQDILDLSAYSLKGAVYGVFSDEACTNRVVTLTTGDDGKTNTPYLPCTTMGTFNYWVKEITPPAGHILSGQAQKISVSLPADGGKIKPLTFENDPETTTLSAFAQKLDAKGWPVAGVVFEVKLYDGEYDSVNACPASKLKKTWYLKSDNKGNVEFDRDYLAANYQSNPFYMWNNKVVIPIGCTVTYQEVQAPSEYKMDQTVQILKIKNQTIQMDYFYNDIHPCKIKIRKLDEDGVTPLQGVKFELTFIKESEAYKDNKFKAYVPLLKEGESVEAETDSNGYIVWENLDQGEYQIVETKTLEGKTLLKDPINITLPITMTDKQAKDMSAATDNGQYDVDKKLWYFYEATYEVTNTPTFVMPITGSNGFWKFGFIGFGTIAVLGTGLIIFDKKGKKQKHRRRVTKK